MKFNPLRDIVIIQPDAAEQQTSGGVFLISAKPENDVQTGTVLAVGPGVEINGRWDSMVVRPGDRVLFNKGTGYKFELDKIKYLNIKQRDLMGILRAD